MTDHNIEIKNSLKTDTHSYKGWLNSDSFLKRAFASLGYQTVASFIILIPFYIIVLGFLFSIGLMIPDNPRMDMDMDTRGYDYVPEDYYNKDF